MIRHLTAAVLLILALLSLAPMEGRAQPGELRTEQMNRQQLLERIQDQFQEQLARALQLTPEQRELLPGILADFERARAELAPARREFIGRVRAVLSGDRSESEALALIQGGRALRDREMALLVREEERLLEVLNPSQVLLLQGLRDEFEDFIRTVGNRDTPQWFNPGGRGFPGSPANPRP